MSEIGLIEPFFRKDAWIVHCDRCGHSEEILISLTSESALEDLAECTYLHYWIEELKFLEALKRLIERHPRSDHPYKRMVLGIRRRTDESGIIAPADAPFERELALLLAEFGRDRNGSFSLQHRTKAGHASIEEQTERVAKSAVICKTCENGRMHVDPVEFETF
ncbi:MAG: hypothetical protein IT473_00595 [Lysobacter sp.]|nr:hypothetical protein [Lysobacter sp.]